MRITTLFSCSANSFFFPLIVLVFFTQFATAQNQYHIDSLQKQLQFLEEEKNKSGNQSHSADSTKANLLSALAGEYYWNDQQKVKEFADSAMTISKGIGYEKGVALAYDNLGVYCIMIGNYDSALNNLHKSLAIKTKLKDKKGVAGIYNSIGAAYDSKGDYPEALKNYLYALKLREELGDKRGFAVTAGNVGNVYGAMENYPSALEMQQKALKISLELNDTAQFAWNYYNLGILYIGMNNDSAALINLTTALELNEKIGSKADVANICIHLGGFYKDKANYSKALDYYTKAMEIYKSIGDKQGLASGNIYIGAVYETLNELPLALKYETAGANSAKEMGLMDRLPFAYNVLSAIYQKMGKYKEAYDYSVLYKNVFDSLYNQENDRMITRLQMQYEFDKKEAATKAATEKKELQLKGQKNTFIFSSVLLATILILGGIIFYINRKRKETLYKQNVAESEMKALRAQMNPHFMFNSLNAIQNMVLNHDNDNAFQYLNTYSKLTRSILENSEKKWIPLSDEIKFLELYLKIESLRFQDSFSYEIKTADNVSVHADEIPAMIIQPLVENAIKHGLMNKEGEKKLLIAFNKPKDNGHLEVIVEDNGIGRAMAGHSKKESDHKSMSLSITENRLRLLDQNGGSKIIVEDLENGDKKNSGTRVRVLIAQPD
ncbi:MAG TPA: tetratricopeptide repeat protein [Chitinophagales bacterium]|nr:tetratricopeptide repeat protein [Chitinophagales bacterium]